MRQIAGVGLMAATILASGCNAEAQEGPWARGLYVGLAAGYSSAVLRSPDPIDWAAAGLTGGVYGGWGMVGNSGLYLGFELDWMAKDITWRATDASGISAQASGKWVGSGRLRVGQTFGPALIYLTGGAALSDQHVAVSGFGSTTDWRYGWVAGGGIETMIGKTLTLRLEGLHYDFPDKSVFLGGGSEKLGTQETVVRVGVGFKLN